MKIPKIKKLPSGSYFCRIRTGGRDYAITGQSYDQVYAEAVAYKAGIIKAKRQPERVTVKLAAERYIEEKNNILSPASVRQYENIAKTALAPLHNMSVEEASERRTLQTFINNCSTNHAPKTVRSIYRFLAAALAAAGADLSTVKVTLPEKRNPALYTPTDDDMATLIEHVRGTEMELPVLLAASGSLRRSEICALTREDVTDTGVWITKAKVKNGANVWVVKTTKETSSLRHAPLPAFVLDKLRTIPDGQPVTRLNPDVITSRFERIIKRLGVPRFRFHDLRSYWTTVAHAMGMPDYYLMKNGGWSTMQTPRNHYMRSRDELIKASHDATHAHMDDVLNGNENGNEKK